MSWQPQTFQSGWQPMSFQAEAQPKPELKGDLGHQAAAGLLSFGQGGMPIFDEAGAAAGAGLEKLGIGEALAGKVGNEGDSFGDIYDKRLANIRGVEKSFGEQHRVLDPILRVAGGVAGTLPFAGAMAARPVLSGAAYGAAQGFSGAEGGVGARTVGGLAGAGLGAAGGHIASKIGGSGLQNREANLIQKNLTLGDVTPQQYAEALRNSGPDDFAGELGGEPLRMLTQNQAKVTGPAMQPAREAMRARLAQAPQRTQAIIDETIKPAANVENMLGNLEQIGAGSGERYAAAYGQAVPRSIADSVLATPDGQQALQEAAKALANKGVAPEAAGFVADKAGKYSLAENVPTQTMDQIQRALADLTRSGRNPITGAIETEGALTTENLRKGLVESLRKANPEFDKAITAEAGIKAGERSFDMGRRFAKAATGDTADTIGDALDNSLSAGERSYLKAGFAQGLGDVVGNSPLGTGNPAASLAKNRVVERIGQVVDPTAAENFSNRIMAEKLRMELAQRGLYGSNTPELLGSLDVPMSKSGLLNKVVNGLSDRINRASNERLARALYATSPEEKARLAAFLTGQPQGSMLGSYIRNQVPYLPAQVYGALQGGQ